MHSPSSVTAFPLGCSYARSLLSFMAAYELHRQSYHIMPKNYLFFARGRESNPHLNSLSSYQRGVLPLDHSRNVVRPLASARSALLTFAPLCGFIGCHLSDLYIFILSAQLLLQFLEVSYQFINQSSHQFHFLHITII